MRAPLLALLALTAGCLGQTTLPSPGDLPALRPTLATGFHGPEEAPLLLDALAAARPDLAVRFSLGQSVNGTDLPGLALTAPGDASGRVRVLVDGGVHGNEVIGIESVLHMAGWLVENEARNATAARILRDVDLRLAPQMSPDGRAGLTRWNANGVNLNRNFDVDWGNPNPLCRSQTVAPELQYAGTGGLDYAGPSPRSEPESQALAALMEEFQPQIYLSFHTGRHALIRPWGACDPPFPIPEADMAVFTAIESWVQNHTTYSNTGDAVTTASRERAFPPGAASGSTTDYCYVEYHCVALTPEVTLDGGLNGDPVASAEEVLPVWLHILENARDYGAWRVPGQSR